jgi:hypothetical protein
VGPPDTSSHPRIRGRAIPRAAPILDTLLRGPLRSGRIPGSSPAPQSIVCL